MSQPFLLFLLQIGGGEALSDGLLKDVYQEWRSKLAAKMYPWDTPFHPSWRAFWTSSGGFKNEQLI